MSNSDKNSKVGYKNPPKKTQFKKGKSGNPKGRPKKAEHDMLQEIIDILETNVNVTLNGKTQQVSKLHVFILQSHKRACEGHGPSQKIIYDLLNRHVLPQQAIDQERAQKDKEREESVDEAYTDPIAAAKHYKQLIKSL